MPKEDVELAKMLLELKARAHQSMAWSKDEKVALERCFGRGGIISVLAACCVLSSGRPRNCRRSLSILRENIERGSPPPYVELLVYEALITVETNELSPFYDAIFGFIEESLTRRAVNLDNTIVLLGNLARANQPRALVILQTLTQDGKSPIRDNASFVLQKLTKHS
jgi:hypothetical protein